MSSGEVLCAVVMKGSTCSTATWGGGQFLEGAEHHLAVMSAPWKALPGLAVTRRKVNIVCRGKTGAVSGSQLNFNLTFFMR